MPASPMSNCRGYLHELTALAQNAAKGALISCLPFYLGIMFYEPKNFLIYLVTAAMGLVMSFPALAAFAAWSRWHSWKVLPCYPAYLAAGAIAALICGILYGGLMFQRMDDEAGRAAVIFGIPIVFFITGAITAGIHWQWLADRLQDDKRG